MYLQPIILLYRSFFFFFNDTATTEIYTLSLHDALPISRGGRARSSLGASVRIVCPAWQAQREHGAAVRGVGDGEVASVQARVLPRDGEAEAAALGPGPGRVGLVEPVEHVRQHRFVQPRSVVADLESDPVRVGGKPYRHRWLAVPQGVADQVREDDVHSARVQPCRHRGWKIGRASCR